MIDNFKPKIQVMGDNRLLQGLPKGVTKTQAIAYINNLNYEEEIKRRLIIKINSFPSNTLGRALKNLQELIAKVRQEIENDERTKGETEPTP